MLRHDWRYPDGSQGSCCGLEQDTHGSAYLPTLDYACSWTKSMDVRGRDRGVQGTQLRTRIVEQIKEHKVVTGRGG